MTSPKSFNQFFENDLNGVLASLESERISISRLGRLCYLLIGIAFILFIIMFQASIPLLGIAGLAFIIPGIVLFISFQNRKRRFIAGFKQNVILPVIKFIDPGFRYNPASCISEGDYKKSGLYLTEPDRYNGDDYIEGVREKTVFCFSELHTEHKVSSGKNTHWETIFKGLFFIADFNKNFSGRTYVWSEQNPQLGFFAKYLSSFASTLSKVKLESIDFENRFIVYSDDQVEARYILTPSFMERLVKVEEMMGAGVSFSFADTNIYVAVPIRDDLFEPSIFSANDYNKVGDYYNTVQIVLDLIDELQLNQRLWNKK